MAARIFSLLSVLAFTAALSACVESDTPLLPTESSHNALAARYAHLQTGKVGNITINWVNSRYVIVPEEKGSEQLEFTVHPSENEPDKVLIAQALEKKRYKYSLIYPISGGDMIMRLIECDKNILDGLKLQGVRIQDYVCIISNRQQLEALATRTINAPLHVSPYIVQYQKHRN